MFSKKKKNNRVSWEYLKKRYPDVIEELKSLRNWNEVKSSIPEAESMGDYSIVALHAISALIQELRIERELLGERVEVLNSKLESLRADSGNTIKSLKKEIEDLKRNIEELEKRTIFLDSVEKFVPKVNELEEKIERYPMEIVNRLEERYSKQILEMAEEIINRRFKELEDELKRGIFGVSVDLAKVLKEIQDKYESLIKENIKLNELLKEKDAKIKELTYKLSKFQETASKVEELSKRLDEYKQSLAELSQIKQELAKITGVYEVKDAIKILREEFVPKSKVEMIAKEIKTLMDSLEKIKRENEKLKKENERLKEVVKALLSKQEETGESEG